MRKLCGFEEIRAFILDQIPGKRGQAERCDPVGYRRWGEQRGK